MFGGGVVRNNRFPVGGRASPNCVDIFMNQYVRTPRKLNQVLGNAGIS